MPLFTIDESKCNYDGLCAKECPAGCIVFEPEQPPVPHEKKYAYCIECGHCMAVCPTNALQLERFTGHAIPMSKELRISFEQAGQFLKGRRSTRAFRSEALGYDLLEELLDITQFAPSGHNARPVKWAVAPTPEKVHGVAEATANWMRSEVEKDSMLAKALHLSGIVRAWENDMDLICRHAPALAVAHGPKRGITPMEDGVIAVTYLELAATGAGLGACWCGYVQMAAHQDDAIRQLLGIPQGGKVHGALMLGKPARRMKSIPPRPKAEVNWL